MGSQAAAACAGVVAPTLPAGTPQAIAGAVQAVAGSISAFISQLPTATSAPPGGKSFAPSTKGKSAKLSKDDQARIHALQARAQQAAAKIKQRRANH